MLRRNTSNRLSHRKSTSSVHSKHESIDPEVAHHHAHTAATLAFARAQAQAHNVVPSRSAGGISRSNTSNQQDGEPYRQTEAINQGDRVVRRQHSVRFVGPTGIQRQKSISSRATRSQVVPAMSGPTLRPIALTNNAPVPALYRPPSRSSSIGKASLNKAFVDDFLLANAAYDEYFVREEDVASTPSSYRRIRRSKSMFSPLKAPSIFYNNGTPDRTDSLHVRSFTTSQASQTQPPLIPLRAPKSMSFLRGSRDHLASATRGRNDTAVQLARDRFFQQTTQQRLREQPSFLLRSRIQRQEKPFRKSVRSSSGNYGTPNTTPLEAQKVSSLKEAARKASKTIRSKLMRVFGRNKDGVPVEIPYQQVDARETHVRNYNGDLTTDHGLFSDIPHPTATSLSKVASRIPSLHAVASNQQLRSHSGSLRSFVTDNSEEKSRVTSWNSTGMNTVASQQTRVQAERDHQQRLSIINENGTHVSKSSFGRPKIKDQFPSYLPNGVLAQAVAPSSGLVDSARVYSALMKRLDENSPKAKLEASRMPSKDSVASHQVVPTARSVNDIENKRTPVTIRQVSAETSVYDHGSREYSATSHDHQRIKSKADKLEYLPNELGSRVHQWVTADSLLQQHLTNGDDVFSSKVTVPRQAIHRIHQNAPPGSVGSEHNETSHGTTPYYTAIERDKPTPQELASRNESLTAAPKIVREARSTFFGGSSSFLVSRTPSPFRLSLAKTSGKPISPILQSHSSVRVSPIRNPLYPASNGSSSMSLCRTGTKYAENAYSESVYSRTTSGQAPIAANSGLSFALEDTAEPRIHLKAAQNGNVVIIDRTTYCPTMPKNQEHRSTSSTGSLEWKKWMSSEVAKLEKTKDNKSLPHYINYALPTMPKSGHVRESAQMNDDETEIVLPKDLPVKQPLGIIQQKPNIQNAAPLKPILKNRSAVSLLENIEIVSSAPQKTIPPPPPPIPVRSLLRPMRSKSSLRSITTINSTRGHSAPSSISKPSSLDNSNVLHRRNVSLATLRSTKSTDSTAKLVKRHGRPPDHPISSNCKIAPIGPLDKQLEKISLHARPLARDNRENFRCPQEKRDLFGVKNTQVSDLNTDCGVHELGEREAQVLGSKRMVDLFLSSRRRRIASGSDEDGAQMFL